jgi:hypothetical protein
MNKNINMMKFWTLTFIIILSFGCNSHRDENQTEDNFPVLTGKYIGQNEPGLTPEIFAPNIVSTGMSEINACFSPDYTEFCFSVVMPNRQFVIMSMKYDNQQWSAPEVASFSGVYSEADPFITANGEWLYFVSKRPSDSVQTPKTDWDIWRVENINGEWVEPEHLGPNINSDKDDIYPSLTKEGTLYFSSGRFGRNNRDIYYAKSNGTGFEPSVKLNDTINKYWEGDIFISPDEDYMIFRTYGRPTGNGLYITFNNQGQWSTPQNMGEEINKTGDEFCPIVDPDGKYFFFSSRHLSPEKESGEKWTYQKIKDEFVNSYKHPGMGKTDIYWVSTEIINKLKLKSNVN